MGYVPGPPPPYDKTTATLYTIARIFDVGNQLLAQSGVKRKPALPRTYQEYRDALYGRAVRDWLPALGWGLLISVLTLLVIIAAMVADVR